MSTTPDALPTLAQVEGAVDEVRFLGERAKRVYAVMRWASTVALTELRDGYEAALEVVNEGPARFMPTDEEFEQINLAGTVGINFVEGGQ